MPKPFLPLLLASALLAAGCGGSEATTQRSGSTPAGAPTTGTPSSDAPPATTAAAPAASAGSTAAAGAVCDLVTAAEIERATGLRGVRPEPSGDRCLWDAGQRGDGAVDVSRARGTARQFADQRTLYGREGGPTLEGLGDEAFVHALDAKVTFRQGGSIYEVWVQALPDAARELPAAIELARAAARRR